MTALLYFMDHVGVCFVGFATLTFRSSTNIAEANASFERFLRASGREWITHWIKIIEVDRRNRLHLHLLLQCRKDIAAQTDFEAVKAYAANNRAEAKPVNPTYRQRRVERDKTTENQFLLAMWHHFDHALPKAGFAWEWNLFPVLEPVAVAKYATKSLDQNLRRNWKLPKRCKIINSSRLCPKPAPQDEKQSEWFQELVRRFRGACDANDPSYFAQRLKKQKWSFLIIRLAHALDEVAPSWRLLSYPDLARLVIRCCVTIPWIGNAFDPIVRDLLKVAGVLSPPVSETLDCADPF